MHFQMLIKTYGNLQKLIYGQLLRKISFFNKKLLFTDQCIPIFTVANLVLDAVEKEICVKRFHHRRIVVNLSVETTGDVLGAAFHHDHETASRFIFRPTEVGHVQTENKSGRFLVEGVTPDSFFKLNNIHGVGRTDQHADVVFLIGLAGRPEDDVVLLFSPGGKIVLELTVYECVPFKKS